MNKTSLVSVIIPVYNSSKFIKKTVKSVLNQTYSNFEILIIDDCSIDSTRNICKELQILSDKIFYYRLKKNSGAAVARNIGIKKANGRYIAFLDSDDEWTKDKLRKQINFMNQNHVAFCFSAYDMVNKNGIKIKNKIRIKKVVSYNDLLTKTIIATPTVVLDTYIIGKIEMPLRRTGQDYAYWLLLLKKTKAYGIDEALVHVCKRNSSLSKNKFQNIKDIWEVQTINENIPQLFVANNVIMYCLYTIKKRFFY